jgi:hypothetical protein
MVGSRSGMIGSGEASRVTCQPPRVRLEIYFDLQLGPSHPLCEQE